MFDTLPTSTDVFLTWDYAQIEPYITDLLQRDLSAETVQPWLKDWTQLFNLYHEGWTVLRIATAQNTADEAAENRLNAFMETIFPKMAVAENALQQKWLASGLSAPDFDIATRNMAADAALYRAENLPLKTALQKLTQTYSRLTGTLSIEWDGDTLTIPQALNHLQSSDRATRRAVWERVYGAYLAQREAINENWTALLNNRLQQARNAGFGDDYRAYAWQDKHRFDYTPDDCKQFHAAIEQVVVPAMSRRLAKRKAALGLDELFPYDMLVDINGDDPLKPYDTPEAFDTIAGRIFNAIDPRLGGFFGQMMDNNLLDLHSRPGKRPGGFCASLDVRGLPFILMNASGSSADVRVLMHESGHAFHVFQAAPVLDYYQQGDVPMEFAEVASQSMELLTAPYLARTMGGYYTTQAATRAQIAHLEMILSFWPYMAVVDAFQHAVYENPTAALDPAWCDATWDGLWDRFMPGVSWTGYEEIRKTGWHRKGHIHGSPFYYIEYGLAWLGAVQIWNNALHDREQAIADYLRALALGGKATLPDLFSAAGATFAFDADTLHAAVTLIEEQLAQLEGELVQ